MSKYGNWLESIAGTIGDYRNEEINPPTAEHVEKWVTQFDQSVRGPMLKELDYVLKKTYVPMSRVEKFLSELVKNEKLCGTRPKSFWKDVVLMDIQGGGNSQKDMLKMFFHILERELGLKAEDCGQKPKVFLYLDDFSFTGNRVLGDLKTWISSSAPGEAKVLVVTIAYHRGGQYYANGRIQKAADGAGKKIELEWWRIFEIEDRKNSIDSSDVLRPTVIPNDSIVQTYVSGLKYPPVLRTPGSVGELKFFSGEEGRHLLEQELLKAGAKIRSMCPYLGTYQRPLGNMILDTLGFGSLLVTFRNCPNNCPLAFWAGDPWYPLFPRKIN